MVTLKEIRSGLGVSLWFIFLTFPLLVIKVNPIDKVITWRWQNMVYVGLASFFPGVDGIIIFGRVSLMTVCGDFYRWRRK